MKRCHMVIAVWLVIATVPDTGAPKAPADRTPNIPNIVIIRADDLGYGDLRCYSADSRIPTRHPDRLAAADRTGTIDAGSTVTRRR